MGLIGLDTDALTGQSLFYELGYLSILPITVEGENYYTVKRGRRVSGHSKGYILPQHSQ
jgi:hypothetical protein